MNVLLVTGQGDQLNALHALAPTFMRKVNRNFLSQASSDLPKFFYLKRNSFNISSHTTNIVAQMFSYYKHNALNQHILYNKIVCAEIWI